MTVMRVWFILLRAEAPVTHQMLHVKQHTPGKDSSNNEKGESQGNFKVKKKTMLRRRRSKECQRRKKTKLISGRTVTSRESEEPTYMHGENNTERRSDTESVPSAPKRVVKPEKKQQVQVFVETTFRKGVQGLIEEFRSMKRTNDFTLMKEFVAQNAYGRNRYKDVGCLDNRRVVIRIGNVPYIHANYVATPNHPKRFICTQAPLPKTCYEFWNMVVQERSASILMLCNFVEMNVKKCAEYFPTDPGGCLDFDGVRVVCKKQDYFQFPIETKVQVRMTFLDVYGPSCPVHSCIHYHWLDWPDRGVPEADLTPIALLSKLKNSAGPIIVHCSAGIGRTGSIVLLQHAMELLHRPAPLLEIREYLIELRKQRNNSIQTEHQYLYVHQVLLLYLNRARYLDDSVQPYLEEFTKDYYKATKGF